MMPRGLETTVFRIWCGFFHLVTLIHALVPVRDNFLLFVDGPQGKLFQMALNGTAVIDIPIRKPQNPVAVDYDPKERVVYWSDLETRSIRRITLDNTSKEELFYVLMPGSSPEGIAIDSVARLLFYTDNGRSVICAIGLNVNRDHKVIVAYVLHPRSIQVDPISRHIYWTDWGLGTIERASYNGRHRTVILEGSDKWINGLALDLLERTMYWTDAQAGVIEKSNMDGTGKTILVDERSFGRIFQNDSRSHYYGITLDNVYLYYTDWSHGIFRAKKDGSNRQMLMPVDATAFYILNGIKAYSSSLHKQTMGVPTACQSVNGGCSNLCIPLSRSNYICECPDFQKLDDDDATCVSGVDPKGPDLIWIEHDNASNSYIRGIRGEPADYLRTHDVLTWTVRSPAWMWTAVDMDYANRKLYLADKIDRYLVQLSIKEVLNLKVVLPGISSAVNGIAVDWIAGNIYWTDGLYKWIAVAKAEEKTKGQRTLISSGLNQPHGIVVWPQQGMMFWSDLGPESKIQSATMLGEKITTLVGEDLDEPRGLSMDYHSERLYWCNQHSIQSIFANGSGLMTHVVSIKNYFTDIALHMNFIIATERMPNSQNSQLWIYDRRANDSSGFKLRLTRPTSAIVMYDERKQQKFESSCKDLQCEHLCITTNAYSSQCVCYDGFNIAADQKRCIENLSLLRGPTYIYSIGDQICSIPVKDSQTNIQNPNSKCFFGNPSSPYEFRALDFNYRRGELFFSETKFRVRSIRKAHLVEKRNNTAIVHGVGLVKGIAVDWMTENLYWTDYTSGQVWMSRSDGRYQKVIARNLSGPHGIVIDMIRRKIYWTENKQLGFSRIAQANMDGSNTVTLFADVNKPTGLGIEYNPREDRIYWTDVAKRTIESLGMSSMVHRLERVPMVPGKTVIDVASYQDFLVYTSAEPGNTSVLHVFEKVGQREVDQGVRHPSHKQPFDVVVFAEVKQPLYNGPKCSFADNGGCEQLLVQTSDGQCLCSCADGYSLAEDNRTCVSADLVDDEFFLVADDYRHQIYQVHSDFTKISAIGFPPQDRPIGIEYDFTEMKVYWTDFESNVIKRSYLNGSDLQVIHVKTPGSRIDGIALSAESRLLYFADSSRNEIGVMTLDGRFKKIVINRNLSNPRALVLDEANGYMFYAVRNASRGRIDRCWMDGSNCITVIKTNTSWPNAIAIDSDEKRIYWCDSHTEKIESASLDGANRRTLYVGSPSEDPFSVALQGSFVYWTDWGTRGISRIAKNGNKVGRLYEDYFRGPNDIKFFNRTAQKVFNRCSENNGGCSHFCIPIPNQGRICACPDVDELGGQGGTYNCSSIAVCPNVIANGHFHQQCAFTVGSSCQFTCNPGYGAATKELISCQHNLQWSRDLSQLCLDDTCPLLINPENALVDLDCPQVAAVGVSCSQHCVDGFTWTDGDRLRTCGPDLKWTGLPIVCSAFTCPELRTPANASVDAGCPQPAGVGTECRHNCLEGFLQRGGDNSRVCEEGRGWSGTPLVCVSILPDPPPIQCPVLAALDGVLTEPEKCVKTGSPVGTECSQHCATGLVSRQSNSTRTCLTNQTWSGIPVVCLNGTVSGSKLTSDIEIEHHVGGRRRDVGLIVGLTIGMLILSSLVIASVFLLCRCVLNKSPQSQPSSPAGFGFNRQEEIFQPVSPSIYYAKGGFVSLDDRLSFENPVATANIDASKSEGEPSTSPTAAGSSRDAGAETSDKVAFVNMMFE